jgi:hypothetical protein
MLRNVFRGEFDFQRGLILVKFFRRLTRAASGYHVVAIPPEAAAHIGLAFGGMVSMELKDGEISIKPVREVTQNA